MLLDEVLEDTNSSWCKNKLKALIENPSTHDVTFKTSDGGSVSAHRVIVAAGSPVFHAMLYGNIKERSQKEIDLPNIDSSTLKNLFSFLYSGHVQTNLMGCVELLQVANYFDIKELKTMCLKLIENKLCLGFEYVVFNIIAKAITKSIRHIAGGLL